MVLFEIAGGARTTLENSGEEPLKREEAIASASSARQIVKLKKEVAEARRRLLSVMEEHQISDEENQSAVEESVSTNEELQSLNEELETAKEGLQSTNEELLTVNQELGSKNTVLTESVTFAMSIVETVRAPLLVLDHGLRIRTVNEWFSRTFRIPRGDAEGQFLYSLGGGSWDIPGLRDLLVRVLSAGESFDNFEVECEFPSIAPNRLPG